MAPVRSARQHRTPAPAAHQHGTPAAAAHQHGADEHGADEHGAHENAGEGDAPTEYDQAFWDARYAESESIWSGNPNPVLVAEASTLSAGSGSAPRSALDIGSGEGADAIWLAERGWQVTAVDISPVALARAADRASARGVAADQITWEHHDLTAWTPPPARFDLVSAQFMHLPQTQREVLFRDLAAAVADGGTLLIVGHDMVDLDVAHRWNIPGMFYSADELAATLDPTLWHIAAAESRARTVTAQEETVTLHDVVLRAERRRGN
nr:class I SAM-dependent methyltransferase [Glaciihabitans tibetensis]